MFSKRQIIKRLLVVVGTIAIIAGVFYVCYYVLTNEQVAAIARMVL